MFRSLTRDGELIGLEGIVRDITLWHRAEEALSAERNLLKEITEASPIGIGVVDLDGRITFANQVIESLMGCGEGELIGRRYAELDWELTALDGTPLPAAERPITRVLATGAPVSGVRLQMMVPGLGTRVLSVSVTPLKNREGEMTGVLVLSEDISEQVRIQQAHEKMELELRQAQKMEAIGRLAGGVAHDFNNMLAVILGVTEVAMADIDPESQLGQDLQEIDRAAQRSVDLTRQLLAFSRKQVIQPQSVNLDELIHNRKAMLTRMIGEEISVDFRSAPDLWNTWIDPSQVDQILANLLVNARDAIDGVGTIAVEMANCRLNDADSRKDFPVQEGQFVRLTVTDSGAGIEPSHLEHIFEPFFTTKKEGEGTGLGLSTVYGIVKQNGGLIRVHSEPGKGASFEVYLPHYRGQVGMDEKGHPRRNVSGSETVLIVEDEEVLLKLAKRFLEKHGYRVLVAHTPLEAIGLVHEYAGEIHLLLTDVVMPGMNGRQLDLRLREIRPRLKTIYMSGYTADVIARRGILEPGIEFIQKPFAMEALAEHVRSVLDGNGKTR